MSLVLAALQRRAQVEPNAIALCSGDSSLTYAALLDRVGQAEAQLRSLRVKSLGLYLDNGFDWVIYDLAANACAVHTVALPGFFSAAQRRHAISDAGLDTILFDRALPEGVCGHGAALAGFYDSRLQRIEPRVARESRSSGRQASGPSKISYTSGSTGSPRGIRLTLQTIEQTAQSLCQAIGRLDIEHHLSLLPYATLLEQIAGIYAPLMLGRCLHAEASSAIGLTATLGLDPLKLASRFQQLRPNSLIVTPQLLAVLCQMAESRMIDTASLAFVAVGGAHLSTALLQRARAASIPAYEGYGLTEFASVATLNLPWADRPGSVGKPLPGVSVTIAEDGEICLSRTTSRDRGETIMSGDYGRLDDDGYVYIEGRKSSRIVLANGRNIAPEWVETELNRSQYIQQSFVFAVDETHLEALLFSTATDRQIESGLRQINRGLPAYARLRNWHRLNIPFSHQRQTLTANGRLRREKIAGLLPGNLAQRSLRQSLASG